MERQLIADLTEKIRGAGSPREILVKRVAGALREQIAAGQLKPGARLISEVALARSLEISRPTLREAMRILAREGLLDIKHGVGAFVADEHRLIWSRLDAMRSFTDLIRSVGGAPGDSGLKVDRTPAPDDVAEALDMPPRTPVGLVRRVRLIDGAPLSIANEYVRLNNPDEDFARLKTFPGGSLYNFLRDRCGVTLARSSVVIAAVPADAARAKLLKVPRRTPLLLLREPHYDLTGKPVLFAVNYHNSNLVQFTLARAGLST
ncbi:MAG TPA: GntR family transcriptional regulator [Roseiarcus sp.]|nr:GntR family transcriptional regulator [Roseiarcus sp.]